MRRPRNAAEIVPNGDRLRITIPVALAIAFAVASAGGRVAAAPAIRASPVATKAHVVEKRMHIYSLGDSITFGAELDDPEHTAYPYVLGKRFGAIVTDLARGGAASGINTEGDIVRSQLDLVRTPCDVVTLNVGTNDITLLAGGYYTLADFKNNIDLIVQVLRETCTQVIVATVIDNAWNVLALGRDKSNWAKDVRLENGYLARLSGVTVVDLNADPRLHEQTSFTAPRFLHPNVAGEKAIAEDLEAAVSLPR